MHFELQQASRQDPTRTVTVQARAADLRAICFRVAVGRTLLSPTEERPVDVYYVADGFPANLVARVHPGSRADTFA